MRLRWKANLLACVIAQHDSLFTSTCELSLARAGRQRQTERRLVAPAELRLRSVGFLSPDVIECARMLSLRLCGTLWSVQLACYRRKQGRKRGDRSHGGEREATITTHVQQHQRSDSRPFVKSSGQRGQVPADYVRWIRSAWVKRCAL